MEIKKNTMEEIAKESTGCQNETKTDKYKLRNLGKLWMEYDGQLEKNMESSPVNAMQVLML